jgi:hypothetical protein
MVSGCLLTVTTVGRLPAEPAQPTEKDRLALWQEAKWAVRSAAYSEYLPDYQPGWAWAKWFSMGDRGMQCPSAPEIAEFARKGVDYLGFYKPGAFPSHLDRQHGMRRYRAWVERFPRKGKLFASDEEFRQWVQDWETDFQEAVALCHASGLKVMVCCTDAFNVVGHVYNENWFGGKDHWETEPADPNDPRYQRLPEGDLIAPVNASADYVQYCQTEAEHFLADFGVDALYYDNNAPNLTLLRATADVVHRHGGVLMLHHSSDNMTEDQYQTADYWYTGEHSYPTPYSFLTRRLTRGVGFMYSISMSCDFWGGGYNTQEPVGFGFLMCALKYPMLYPDDPAAEQLWTHYLPLYKQMVKPGTVAYVGVTDSRFVEATPGQFKPLADSPPLFYDLFVNDQIYLLFTNNADTEAVLKFTTPFQDMETQEVLTEAKMPPQSVLMLVKP